MAKKIVAFIKLQIPAGRATPQPPIGPALGQHGVNIAAFTKEFNERTKNDMGLIIPVIITVYADRSFSFITKTPPQQFLSKRLAVSKQLPLLLTSRRLLLSQKLRLKKSLKQNFPTSTLHPSNLL